MQGREIMRESSKHDTEGLLPRAHLSESDLLATLPTWQRASKSWQIHLRNNLFYLAVIILLSISNITTLLILFSRPAAKQPYALSVNQPPGGVPPTMKQLVWDPTPTFINVSWYTPENDFFREHNSAEADAKWKSYDASSEYHYCFCNAPR